MQIDIYDMEQLYNQRVIFQNPKLGVYYRGYHIAPYKLETEKDIYEEVYRETVAIGVFIEQDYDEVVFYKRGEQRYLLAHNFKAQFKERLPKDLMGLYKQCREKAACGNVIEVSYLPEELRHSFIKAFLQEALDYKPIKEKQNGERSNVE